MKTDEAALKRYYRAIRSYLPCSRKTKNRILDEIRESVTRYLEESPGADFLQIEAHFGKPQNIAAAYVDDMNTPELLLALRIRKKLITIITTGIIVALTIWGVFLSSAYIEAVKASNGSVEIITEITTDIPPVN